MQSHATTEPRGRGNRLLIVVRIILMAFVFPVFAAVGVADHIALDVGLDTGTYAIMILRMILALAFVVISLCFVMKHPDLKSDGDE
jgi:hypothetical protein